MRLPDKLAENKILPVVFKLLYDLLFLLLLFFALTLAAEGLLPGIISRYFGISKIIILVLGNVFLITLLGNFLKIGSAPRTPDKKMILAISFFGIVLIVNSLLKLGVILNLFVTLLAVAIAYFVYLIVTQEER